MIDEQDFSRDSNYCRGLDHSSDHFLRRAPALPAKSQFLWAWQERDHLRCWGLDGLNAGGANAVRSLRFKEDRIAPSRRLGLPLRIAHCAPYTSKWHPIEHRLFSQVERALRGVMLDSPQTALIAQQFMPPFHLDLRSIKYA